jgi:antitoxin component of MazEF toxin-antitoxin module
MIRLSERNLIGLANVLCVTLPQDWVRRFKLIKGDKVQMLITDNALVIFDGKQDFEVKELTREINDAIEAWKEEEEQKTTEWMQLTPEEKSKILKMRAEIEEEDLKRAKEFLEGADVDESELQPQ